MSRKADKPSARMDDPSPIFSDKDGIGRLRALIHAQPVGPGRLTDDERAFLEGWREKLEEARRTATPSEIREEMEAILSHYPARPMTEKQAERYALDWCNDLAHLAPDVIRAACAAYRRSPATYPPSPGAILAFANPVAENRQYLARQVDRLLTPVRMPHAAD